METGKRKRSSDSSGGPIKERKPVNEPDPVTTVDDADVDEFFAILRRMHEASKCNAVNRNGAVRPLSADGAKWRPAFVWEDFEAAGDADGGGDGKAEDGGRRCLDLNAVPEP